MGSSGEGPKSRPKNKPAKKRSKIAKMSEKVPKWFPEPSKMYPKIHPEALQKRAAKKDMNEHHKKKRLAKMNGKREENRNRRKALGNISEVRASKS